MDRFLFTEGVIHLYVFVGHPSNDDERRLVSRIVAQNNVVESNLIYIRNLSLGFHIVFSFIFF